MFRQASNAPQAGNHTPACKTLPSIPEFNSGERLRIENPSYILYILQSCKSCSDNKQLEKGKR